MSHLEELDEPTRVLHDKMVALMRRSGQPDTPEEVVRVCVETATRLADLGRWSEVQKMLGILVAYREHVESSAGLLALLERSMAGYPVLSLSVVKSILRRPAPVDRERIQALLVANGEARGVNGVLRKYFGGPEGEQERTEPVGEDSAVFFCELAAMVRRNETPTEYVLRYLRDAKRMPNEDLARVVELLPNVNKPNYNLVMEILSLYRVNAGAHRMARMRGTDTAPGTAAPLFKGRLLEMISQMVLESALGERQIESLVAQCADALLPAFIPMIRAVNEQFLRTGRFVGLLRNIANYIRVEEFIEIVQPLRMKQHALVLKGVSNVDLEVFVRLHSECEKATDPTDLHALLTTLPAFCSYCTDHAEVADQVLAIMKAHALTHRNVVASAIERLVHSHRLNLTSALSLGNPIDRSVSARILEQLRTSGLFEALVAAFLESDNNECDRALAMLIELTGANPAKELECAILQPGSLPGVSLIGALRLLAFFAGAWVYNFDLIAELLDLRTSPENNIQKRAYFLLHALCRAQRIPCFCDVLFSSADAGMHPSATRNRLMLLYTIARRGCENCKCDNMQQRFFTELVRYAKNANVKARKFAASIITELVDHPAFYDYLLNTLTSDNEDTDLVNGALEATALILDHVAHNQEYLLAREPMATNGSNGAMATIESNGANSNTAPISNSIFAGLLFSKLSQIAYSSEAIIKQIIRNLTIMYEANFCASLISDISHLLSKYISMYNKKFNRELRSAVLAAKYNNHKLTREMALLLKFRNNGGTPKEIQVLKNRAE